MSEREQDQIRIASTTRAGRDRLLAELRTLYGARLRVSSSADRPQPVGDVQRWTAYVTLIPEATTVEWEGFQWYDGT